MYTLLLSGGTNGGVLGNVPSQKYWPMWREAEWLYSFTHSFSLHSLLDHGFSFTACHFTEGSNKTHDEEDPHAEEHVSVHLPLQLAALVSRPLVVEHGLCLMSYTRYINLLNQQSLLSLFDNLI